MDGSGRRYIDARVSGAPQRYGSSTLSMMNSALGRDVDADADQPARQQQAERLPALADVETSAPSQLEPSLVRKIGSSPRDP